MRQREVFKHKQRLDHLFKQINAFKGDDELVAHWSKYLCVLVCGFLEVAIFEIYSEYARSKSNDFVANYVQKQLRRFQTPNMEKILSLTSSFNRFWGDELAETTKGELKDAVDSIANIRNNIAHGRDTTITYGRVKTYYRKVVKVVCIVEDLCSR